MSNERLREYIQSEEWALVEEELDDARYAVFNANPDDSTRLRNALIRLQMLADFINVLKERARTDD